MDRAQKRRPTIAKKWQLAVLRKLQAESGTPTEEQRSAAAAETGLDEKWVRNWFIRQRSKLAARDRKSSTEPRSATVPTFRLQLYYPPPDPPSRRPASTPVDPVPSPASLESRSPRPSHSTTNTPAIPRSHRSVSAPIPLNKPFRRPTIPTYSRDPLCNRYPDFSQFFRPHAHQQFRTFELSAPISDHNDLVHRDMDSHAPVHFQGLFNPLHLGGLSTYQTNLQSCPVALSMRLVDLLGHSSLA